MAEFLSSLDQIALLRKSIGSPATGDVPDALIVQYIWLGECDIAEMYEFPALRDSEDVPTEAGTYDYEMTEPDILRFLDPANNITSGFPMSRMDADWDRNIGSLITGEGPAFFWFENGEGSNGRKQIRVRPIPSGVETLRIPFIKIPTMFDTDTAMASDLPVSHTLQVLSRSSEIGLQLLSDRKEAAAQTKLTPQATYAARHALPGAAFYVNRLESFQSRMNRSRRRRG